MIAPPPSPSRRHPCPKAPVALITGAARRIGRSIAEALAADGHPVALHYNGSQEEAGTVVAAITAAGGRAMAFQADLHSEDGMAGLLPTVTAALGPVGVLVNNASTFEQDSLSTATRASWDLHMQANLRAPFVLCQQMAALLPDGAHGSIINLIDQRVWALPPDFMTYTLSKAGLWTLTQTLALALAPRIRVNAIGPGPALPSKRQSPEQFAAQAAAMPLGHGTNPSEIADTVRFLLAAGSMTGQMIALDGGQHLGWALPGVDMAVLAE